MTNNKKKYLLFCVWRNNKGNAQCLIGFRHLSCFFLSITLCRHTAGLLTFMEGSAGFGSSSTLADVLWYLRGFAEEALLPTTSSQQQGELNKHLLMTFQAAFDLKKKKKKRGSWGGYVWCRGEVHSCRHHRLVVLSNHHIWPRLQVRRTNILVHIAALLISNFFCFFFLDAARNMSCFYGGMCRADETSCTSQHLALRRLLCAAHLH